VTPELFLSFVDLLPEPTLLVSGDGKVLAANRATGQRLGVSPAALRGNPLTDAVTEPPDEVAKYLRACSRSRQMCLGALTVSGGLACRAEGAVLQPAGTDGEVFVLMRLVPKESTAGNFVALNQQIDDMSREIHRRKVAEESLHRHEKWLQVTLSSIGDGVITTDTDGCVTFMNGVAEILTGWRQTEAMGRQLPEVFRIVNEHTREPIENPALRSIREGRIVGLANHTLLIARDGTERPIDSAALLGDGVAGAVLVFRDVTERWRAERERARLAAIVESSEDAIVSKSLDGVIRTWNAGAQRLFGYTPEEAVGKSITLIIPPERLGEEQDILARLRCGERIEHFETVRVTNDGRRIDISLSVSPVRDRDGHVIGASKVARDITDRKHLGAELQRVTEESERRKRLYEAILSGTPDFVYVFSLDHRILYANEALLRMWGYRLEDTIGKTFREIGYEPWHAEMHCREIDQVRATNQPIRGEVPFTGTYGRRIYDYIFVPVFGADGQVEAVAGTTRDVTERKEVEESIRETDRKKDEFIALLAHELRNPLAPIRNGLQVIRLSDNRGARERSQQMMDRQLSHMVRMIDDLLDVSRINRNKMELRRPE
jgi:PAS domain S-box-containing protein